MYGTCLILNPSRWLVLFYCGLLSQLIQIIARMMKITRGVINWNYPLSPFWLASIHAQ